MDTHSKLLALLASAALGLGLAGCAGSADASAPIYKVPTMADMDREKQVLNAERKDKAAKEYAAKVKAEKEAKAKAEAEAKAKAEAEAEAQAGSGVAGRSGAVAKRSYQQRARSNGAVKARKGKATTRSGGGGNDLGWDPSKGTVIQDIENNRKAHPNDIRKPGTCTIIGDKTFCR